jgi:AraC-like DNA-binding protein
MASSHSLVQNQHFGRVSICLEDRPEVLLMGVARHIEPAHEYKLNGLWCMHLYRYNGELVLNGERLQIRPGSFSLIPPETLFQHVWPERPAVHFFAHFRLRRGSKVVPYPILQPTGERFESLWDDLVDMVAYYGVEDSRVAARIWDVLWRMTLPARQVASETQHNATVTRAATLIGARLAESIDIGRLAQEVGVSHNHLIRLFRATYGDTVQGYIRGLRAQKARHLLVNTTMPIKVVAVQCGIPDLHGFNKTIRRVFGKSPSMIRKDSEQRIVGVAPEA